MVVQFKTKTEVRYVETDAMGVVHHGSYAPWFELARIRFLREHGFPYQEFEAQGVSIPVLTCHIDYHSPSRFGDIVEISLCLEREAASRFVFRYEVHCQQKLIATGHTRHIFTNSSGKPLRPPVNFTRYFFKENNNHGI
jgi:acyl-CoA thioester hydrolase